MTVFLFWDPLFEEDLGSAYDDQLRLIGKRVRLRRDERLCVCATTVGNNGVYVYYLKGIVSVCFRCPASTVGFSGTRLYLCVYNQPSWATLKCFPPPGLVGAREDCSLVVSCTRRRFICYSYSWHPLQAQAPLNLSVMACHSLKRTQADSLSLSENLISQHAR